MCLLLAGDVHLCPGPAQRQPRNPCLVCQYSVHSNSKAIDCDECGGWTHIKCCGMPTVQYDRLVETGEVFSYICTRCAFHSLPNPIEDTDVREGHECTSDPVTNPSTAEGSHYECFQQKDLCFLHLNTCSLLPKISELRLIAKLFKGHCDCSDRDLGGQYSE